MFTIPHFVVNSDCPLADELYPSAPPVDDLVPRADTGQLLFLEDVSEGRLYEKRETPWLKDVMKDVSCGLMGTCKSKHS